MPRLSEFSGIAIFMYWLDHLAPHFHAIAAEHEAVVAIADGRHLRGGLPRPAARLVDQWRRLHHEELAARWASAQVPEALQPIEPLR